MKRAHFMQFAIVLLIAQAASAQPAPRAGWRVFGSNEIVVEDFSVSGDRARSPFRLDGTFWTNRLNFNVGWSDGNLRNLAIRAELLATDNDYLPEQGFVIGTFAVDFENGQAAVPYRVEVGDVNADLSRRVLQRLIRGTSIEVQPQFGKGTHSIILLTGSGVPDWRDTFRNGSDFRFTALSWLWQSPAENTNIVANVVSESARAGVEGAYPQPTVDRDHRLASLSARTLIGQIGLEGEVSVLDGDDADGNAASFHAEARRALGVFTWRLRYEDNDQGYAPLGAMGIMAGRSIAEAHAGWRPSPRSWLRGRLQQIEHRASGRSPVSTDIAALTWEAQPMRSRPLLRLEATVDFNRIESDDGLQDLVFRNIALDVRDDFARRYDVTYRAWLRESQDDVDPTLDRSALGQEFVGGRRFTMRGWTGRVAAGFGHRRFRESASSRSWAPVLEANVGNETHFVRLYYGALRQRFTSAAIEDLAYQNRRFAYTFSRASHHVSLEYGQEFREPERSLETDSRRIAARYRYTF